MCLINHPGNVGGGVGLFYLGVTGMAGGVIENAVNGHWGRMNNIYKKRQGIVV